MYLNVQHVLHPQSQLQHNHRRFSCVKVNGGACKLMCVPVSYTQYWSIGSSHIIKILAEKSRSAFIKCSFNCFSSVILFFKAAKKHFSLSGLKPMANWTFRNCPKETREHKTDFGNEQQYFAFQPLALKNKDKLWNWEEYQ